jgi:hypothetical protein
MALACEYVDLLQKHAQARYVILSFTDLSPLDHQSISRHTFDSATKLSATGVKDPGLAKRLALGTKRAYEQLQVISTAVCDIEAKLEITSAWDEQSEEWKETIEYMKIRDYQRALDKLEGLVVQRLLELSKIGLAGTGK